VTPHVQPAITRAASVTPLPRRSTKVAQPELNEIITVHPRQYRDAQQIADHFRDGTPVIINLTQMTEAEARRLIDFASGLSTGLRGRIERVTSKVFLLSPEHIAITGDEPMSETSDLDATFTG
jgi:cell division inhibitor SepF